MVWWLLFPEAEKVEVQIVEDAKPSLNELTDEDAVVPFVRDPMAGRLHLAKRAQVEVSARNTNAAAALLDAPQEVNVYLGVHDSQPLCKELVVQSPEGCALQLTGPIKVLKQEGVLQLTQADRTRTPVMFAYLTETQRHGGILLESALHHPIALIRTGAAFAASQRHVSIVRTAFSADPFGLPMAVVEPQGEFHCVVRCCTAVGVQGDVMLHIHKGDNFVNITNASGGLMATAVPDSSVGPARRDECLTLKVASGVDLPLVMCATISAFKLL